MEIDSCLELLNGYYDGHSCYTDEVEDSIIDCSNYNSKLLYNRRLRGPFYQDFHTGTLQCVGSWELPSLAPVDEAKQEIQRRAFLSLASESLVIPSLPDSVISSALHTLPITHSSVRKRIKKVSQVPAGCCEKCSSKEIKLKPSVPDSNAHPSLLETYEAEPDPEVQLLECADCARKYHPLSCLELSGRAFRRIKELNEGIDNPPELSELPEFVSEHPKSKTLQKTKSKPLKAVESKRASNSTSTSSSTAMEVDETGNDSRDKESTEDVNSKKKKLRWQCVDCKLCSVCADPANDERLLLCDSCDRGFHTFCLKIPLSKPPAGSWICDECVFCVSCGCREPGDKPGSRWKFFCQFCERCYKMRLKRHFCTVCMRIYRSTDTIPMIECSACHHWIHAYCAGFTKKKYESQSSDVLYVCQPCKEDKSAVLDGKRRLTSGVVKSGTDASGESETTKAPETPTTTSNGNSKPQDSSTPESNLTRTTPESNLTRTVTQPIPTTPNQQISKQKSRASPSIVTSSTSSTSSSSSTSTPSKGTSSSESKRPASTTNSSSKSSSSLKAISSSPKSPMKAASTSRSRGSSPAAGVGSSSSPAKTSTDNQSQLINSIVEMGFTHDQALEALSVRHNNLSKAIQYLTDGGFQSLESHGSSSRKRKADNELVPSKQGKS